MSSTIKISADERDAMGYVKGVKDFYAHLLMFLLFSVCFTLGSVMLVGISHPFTRLMLLTVAGWAIGVVVHGLSAYEVIRVFGPKWERELIEQRLGRKL